jgi:ribulose-5-phosphate 4-epimerase/fuculose-1-phosphate aldolase
MTVETVLRDKLSTCTRIFAMQELLGLFGHISAYDPASGRAYFSPSMGVDKTAVQADDILVSDLAGKSLDGDHRLPMEWPIHTVLHGKRADALAVAHLHAPYATLFAIAKREFQPVTLQGSIFDGGLPLYTEPQLVTTIAQSENLAKLIGDRPAAFLRGHGIVVIARDIEQMLYASLILEDEAKKWVEASALGEVDHLSHAECEAFHGMSEFPGRSQRAWRYFSSLEARWDRQPGTGRVAFA